MNFFSRLQSCTMKPIAYSYQRWSSAVQGEGHTEERQTELAEDYANRNGLTLDKNRNMSDRGISAYSGKNITDGALGAFLKAVEEGDITPGSYLLVEDVDSLSRLPVMEALAVFQRIIGAGVTLVTLRDGQQYSLERLRSDWTPLMPIFVNMARGHEESKRKSDLIGKAWKKKKVEARDSHKPHGKNCPMWLDYNKETGYTLNPDRHALVKRIFQLYNDGYGLVAISRILNDEGLKTVRKRAWNVASLDGIVGNRAVIGEYQPRNGTGKNRENAGPPIPNYYPAAVDEATFHLAVKARQTRRVSGASRQPKNYNVWQGVSKCYLCGNALHMVDKGDRKYLHCYGAKRGVCKAGYVRLEVAESVFPEVLAKINSSFSLVRNSSAKLSRQIDQIDAQISEHQDSLRQLAEAMKGVLSPTIMSEVLRREGLVAELTKKRDDLSLSLASEAIVDKQAFFKALDLVSYEGRNRANVLLKELKVTVRFDPARSLFRVMKGDAPALDIFKTDKGFSYFAGDSDLNRVVQRQEGTLRPYLVPDYDDDSDDGAEPEYESEGQDTRDGY